LGDVYQQAGRPKDAQREYDLVEFIGRLSKLSQVLANRELAMFYADREIKLGEAVDLARHELDVRHDVYTYDTLAWALCRNRRYKEAAAAMDKALRLKTEDALLFFHAGMIYRGLGKESEAEAFLERALKTNPHFHIFYASQAAHTLETMSRGTGRAATGDSR
jgi:tetratricopeptide (TPR) repeat protein